MSFMYLCLCTCALWQEVWQQKILNFSKKLFLPSNQTIFHKQLWVTVILKIRERVKTVVMLCGLSWYPLTFHLLVPSKGMLGMHVLVIWSVRWIDGVQGLLLLLCFGYHFLFFIWWKRQHFTVYSTVDLRVLYCTKFLTHMVLKKNGG